MKKSYKITMTDDGKKISIKRTNDGFSSLELLGLMTLTQIEVIHQMAGILHPDEVVREVVVDKEGEANDTN